MVAFVLKMPKLLRGTIIAPLVAALELSHREHPELLPWLIDVAQKSSAGRLVAKAQGVRPMVLGPSASLTVSTLVPPPWPLS